MRLPGSLLVFSLLLTLPLASSVLGADPKPPQVLNIGNGAEPRDLDPQTTTGIPETHISNAIFEPLVSKDPQTLEPKPGVAESWKLSQNGKIYTFKLRSDAKWSNGEPVTAQDFVYSWTRLLDPKTAAEYAYQAHYLKNGKAFNAGKMKDPAQLGVKAKDARTLIVTLEDPTPFFLDLLFHHSMTPVPKKTIETFGARWTRPENIVTNGPFMVEKWEINKVVSVKPNPHYWNKKVIQLTQVNFFAIDSPATEERMFRAKELNVTSGIPLEKVPFWQEDKSGAFQRYPYLGTYFYWFNVSKPPMDNKWLRKALTYAIDRERLIKYVLRGGQEPGTHYCPPAGGFKSVSRLPADGSGIAEAKTFLAKAGFPGGKGLAPIELLYNTNEGNKKIAEALQDMWKQNLGIEVKLYNQEWKVYLDNQRTKQYQISRAGWIGDYNDPNTFMDIFTSDNGNNRSGYHNKTYDDLIDAAAKERDAKKRFAIFNKAEDLVLDDLPVLPLYIYTRLYLKDPAVQGYYSNVEDIHLLQFASVKN